MDSDFLKEKIKEHNAKEDKAFDENLKNYLSNNSSKAQNLYVLETPLALKVCGLKDYPIVIAPSTITKLMETDPKKIRHAHSLPDSVIARLPEMIRSPALILLGNKENPKSINIISDYQYNGKFILVGISPNEKQNNLSIHRIATVFEKDNLYNFIKTHVKNNTVLAVDKKKANGVIQAIGYQSPKVKSQISFNYSISYSLDSVKGLDEKFLENLKENLSARYSKEVKTVDENKISSIIKESVTEATAPIVKKVDGVAEQIEILANRVNEQDALITQLVEDNDSKSQIITEQRGIIDEQQATIDELRKELEKALTENKQLKDEKALANDVLKSVSDKLLLAVPQFEHKDYTSQYAEMGELLSDVEFIPADKVHEQKVENAMLKGELTDTKQTLSDIQAELKTVKTENVSLRQEIDRLVSRAEKVMTATIDEPEKTEETDRGNDTPGKEGKSDVEIFER